MGITGKDGRTIVDFTYRSVVGIKGVGIHILGFSVGYRIFNRPKEDKIYCNNFSAKIYLVKNSNEIYLGRALPESPMTLMPAHDFDKTSNILFLIDLSPQQIERIERERNGDDLQFKLMIFGERFDGDDFNCGTESVFAPVNQKAWTDALDGMAWGKYLLYELPMNFPEEDNEIAKAALKSFNMARRHFVDGYYDEAVSKCRMAIESMTELLGIKNEVIETLHTFKTNRKGMSKEQRQMFVISAVRHYTHLAHHTKEDGTPASFSRSEAAFIMGATISAISALVDDKSSVAAKRGD